MIYFVSGLFFLVGFLCHLIMSRIISRKAENHSDWAIVSAKIDPSCRYVGGRYHFDVVVVKLRNIKTNVMVTKEYPDICPSNKNISEEDISSITGYRWIKDLNKSESLSDILNDVKKNEEEYQKVIKALERE